MSETASKQGSSNQNNGIAAVAYIFGWISGLIVLLTAKKEDKFTRFHAIQAIGIGVALTALYIIWEFLFMGLMFSSMSAGALVGMGLISMAIWILALVLIIICAVKAYQGNKFMLPIIGPIAEKNA